MEEQSNHYSGGERTLQNSFWLLHFSRQGRNSEEPRSIFYDKYYHTIFLVDCIIETALYICEAFYFMCLLAHIHIL